MNSVTKPPPDNVDVEQWQDLVRITAVIELDSSSTSFEGVTFSIYNGLRDAINHVRVLLVVRSPYGEITPGGRHAPSILDFTIRDVIGAVAIPPGLAKQVVVSHRVQGYRADWSPARGRYLKDGSFDLRILDFTHVRTGVAWATKEREAREKAEAELAALRKALEDERTKPVEAETARESADAKAIATRREQERTDTTPSATPRKSEGCPDITERSIAAVRESGEELGEVVEIDRTGGKCLFVVRRPDGVLVAMPAARVVTRARPSDQKPLLVGPSVGDPVTVEAGADEQNFPFTYYLRLVQSKIGGRWSPPQVASAGGERTIVFFEIQRDGQIREPTLKRSSGWS